MKNFVAILVFGIVVVFHPVAFIFGDEVADFPLDKSHFEVAASSHQDGEGIDNAFDGKPGTIWHTRWSEARAYPYTVDFTFKKEETIHRIVYLPRQDARNGTILEYEIHVWKNGSWYKHADGTLPENKDEKSLVFPAVTGTKLRLVVTEGVAGFASAAEFSLYFQDTQLGRARTLFKDDACTALDMTLGRTTIKGEIAKLRKTSKRGDVLDLLERAENLLDGKTQPEIRTITLARRRAAGEEQRIYKLGYPWAYFQPTGFAALKNRPLTVMLDSPAGEKTPHLTIVNLREFDWNDQQPHPLVPGRNVIVPTRSGIIYFYNENNQSRAPVVHLPDAVPIPFYRYGKTTREQWRLMQQMPNPYGMVEIAGNRILVTVTAEKAREHLVDPQKLCETFDRIMNVYAKLLGLSPREKDPHGIPQNLMHMIEVDHGFMYAVNHRTCYVSGTVRCILDYKNLIENGWGPWHEIGHMHQVQEYKFQGLGEVTVNIFSLEAQHHFGQRARIDTREMHAKIRQYMADPNRDYHAEEDVFMKLALFWQLRLAFGDDFYPKLHRLNREIKDGPKNDDEKVQYFIRLSSRVSGYDLTPFFLAWGLKPTPETRQYISQGARLEVPIWENMNFSDVKPGGIVPPPKRGRR